MKDEKMRAVNYCVEHVLSTIELVANIQFIEDRQNAFNFEKDILVNTFCNFVLQNTDSSVPQAFENNISELINCVREWCDKVKKSRKETH